MEARILLWTVLILATLAMFLSAYMHKGPSENEPKIDLYMYDNDMINGTYDDVLMALSAVNFPSSHWYAGTVVENGPYQDKDYSRLKTALRAEGVAPFIIDELIQTLTVPIKQSG